MLFVLLLFVEILICSYFVLKRSVCILFKECTNTTTTKRMYKKNLSQCINIPKFFHISFLCAVRYGRMVNHVDRIVCPCIGFAKCVLYHIDAGEPDGIRYRNYYIVTRKHKHSHKCLLLTHAMKREY